MRKLLKNLSGKQKLILLLVIIVIINAAVVSILSRRPSELPEEETVTEETQYVSGTVTAEPESETGTQEQTNGDEGPIVYERNTDVALDSEDFDVVVIDVGYGDAVLVKSRGMSALIDCGGKTPASALIDTLSGYGISDLDYLVITSMDVEHTGGVPSVLASFDVDNILYCGVPGTGDTYNDFVRSISGRSATVISDGDSFDIGSGRVELFTVPAEWRTDAQDGCVAVLIDCCGQRILYTSNLDTEAEKMLIADHDVSCDVYIAGNHGSSISTSDALVEAMGAGACIFSYGDGVTTHYPEDSVVAKFPSNSVYCTDTNGNLFIRLITNGGNCYYMVTVTRHNKTGYLYTPFEPYEDESEETITMVFDSEEEFEQWLHSAGGQAAGEDDGNPEAEVYYRKQGGFIYHLASCDELKRKMKVETTMEEIEEFGYTPCPLCLPDGTEEQ